VVSFSGPLSGLTWSDVLTDADTAALNGAVLTDDQLLQTIKLEGIDQGNVAIKLESDTLEAMGAVPPSLDGTPRTSAYIVLNSLEFQYRVAPRPILAGKTASDRSNEFDIEVTLSFTEAINFTETSSDMSRIQECLDGQPSKKQTCLAEKSIKVIGGQMKPGSFVDVSSSDTKKWEFIVNPAEEESTIDQEIEVQVLADVAQNKQKIANEQQSWKIVYDNTPPTYVIIPSAELEGAAEARSAPVRVIVDWSESLDSELSREDLAVENVNIATMEITKLPDTPPCTDCYEVAMYPLAAEVVRISIFSNSLNDLAGNSNNPTEPGPEFSIMYIPPRPIVTVSSSVIYPTADLIIPFTFSFDKKMDVANGNFDLSRLLIKNGKLTDTPPVDITSPSKASVETLVSVDVEVDFLGRSIRDTDPFDVEVSVEEEVAYQAGTKIGNVASEVHKVTYDNCMKCAFSVKNQEVVRKASCQAAPFGGDPVCSCKEGYIGDGKICNECPGGWENPCTGNGRCTPLYPGAYEGECTCFKVNGQDKWGGAECSTNLLTQPVTDLKATIDSFNSLTLTWTKPKEEEFKIQTYIVDYQVVGKYQASEKQTITIDNPDIVEQKLGNLVPGDKKYVISVTAKNQIGPSNPETIEVLLAPFIKSVSVGNTTSLKEVIGDTRGGDILTILGETFAPDGDTSQLHVHIGDEKIPCDIVAASNDGLECIVGSGVGANLTVFLGNGNNCEKSLQQCVVGVNEDAENLWKYQYKYVTPFIAPNTLRLKKNIDSPGTGNVTGNYPQSDELVFDGYGFGDSRTSKITIKYGNTIPLFECRLAEEKDGEQSQIFHDRAFCKTSYGNGNFLPMKIIVGGQESEFSNDLFSYADTPKIIQVSGCDKDPTKNERTENCDTRGFKEKNGQIGAPLVPIKITIFGKRFGDVAADLNVFIRGEICQNLELVEEDVKIVCELPPGTGSRVPVMISRHQFLSPPENLLSYGIPRVKGITGCSDKDFIPETWGTGEGAASDCPRKGNTRVTLVGENFGIQNAEVYVAGEECTAVQHYEEDPHRKISCELPEPQDTGSSRTVVVIQENGESSRTDSGKLSYEKCKPGNFHDKDIGYHCAPCGKGKFSATAGLTVCNDCHKGYYNDQTQKTQCEACKPTEFQSDEGKDSCKKCPDGQYTNSPAAWQCQKCDSGTYVHDQKCTKCPQFGVECTDGKARALKGYYLYPDDEAKGDNTEKFPEYRPYRCPANYCDGGVARCAPDREGLLCGNCRDGYFPSGSKCYPCQYSHRGLLAIPFFLNFILVIFIYFSSMDDGSSHDGLTKIFLFFIQTTTLFFTINKLGTDFIVFLAFFTFNSMQYMNFAADEEGFGACFQSTALLNLLVGVIQPIVSVFQLFILAAGHAVYHSATKGRRNDPRPFSFDSYKRGFVALFLFCFYSVVTSSVQILACQEIVYGTEVRATIVVAAPSVSCDTDDYGILKILAIVILCLVFLLAIVSLVRIVLAYKQGMFAKYKDDLLAELKSNRDQHQYDKASLEYKEANKQYVAVKSFHAAWSGVYRGYGHKYFYWEYVMLARRTSVICVVSFLHEAYDRYFGLSLICIGSLILHVTSYPFSEPRIGVVNSHKKSWAFAILKGVNHFETLSLSVLALLVQLMLSEDPERDEIILTKVSLILLTLCTIGFALLYVVFWEKLGYKLCGKKYRVETEDEKAVAEDEDDKFGDLVPPDDDEEIPQAVDNEEGSDKEEEQEQPKETGETDSEDDPYAVHKPPKETNDDTDDTGGDTLETDELNQETNDTTGSDVDLALLGVDETQETNDKELDEALAATAATAASNSAGKQLDALLAKNSPGDDLETALMASAQAAEVQAQEEGIVVKKKKGKK